MLFLQKIPFLFVELVPTDFIGASVAADGRLHVACFLVAVTQPAVRESFLVIPVDRLLEVLLCLLVLLKSEQGSPNVVVVDRVVWL